MKYVKGRRSYSMTINNNTTVMIDLGNFRLSLARVILLFTLPVANLAPPSWLAPMDSAVVVDPGLDRSGMVMLCVVNGILNCLILSVSIFRLCGACLLS